MCTWASTSDLRAKIKLCATISWPSRSLIMTSLKNELLIIEDKSCSSFGTPLGTVSASYKIKKTPHYYILLSSIS